MRFISGPYISCGASLDTDDDVGVETIPLVAEWIVYGDSIDELGDAIQDSGDWKCICGLG